LIEGSSDLPNTTVGYYNTHDVVSKQLDPSLFEYQQDTINALKQMGIYAPDKKFKEEVIKKYADRMNEKRIEALRKVIIPESTIDAVALRMLLHGRDFNPAQKGYEF
jgi:hypothetical protein